MQIIGDEVFVKTVCERDGTVFEETGRQQKRRVI